MANEIGLHKLWCQLNLLCVIYISWWTDGEGPGQRYFPQAQPIGCAEGGRGSVWVSGCWTCTLMRLRNTRCRPLCAWRLARECWPRRPCLTSRTDGHWETATQGRVDGPVWAGPGSGKTRMPPPVGIGPAPPSTTTTGSADKSSASPRPGNSSILRQQHGSGESQCNSDTERSREEK